LPAAAGASGRPEEERAARRRRYARTRLTYRTYDTIESEVAVPKLARLKKRKIFVGDVEDIIGTNWLARAIDSDVAVPITASKLRENVYRILDEAIETGVPVEVIRKGTVLTIVPPKRASKLAKLKKRTGFVGDLDDIVSMDWSKEWTELK
jgi:hypothetical protein